jgi:hypothetical protein
MAKKNRLDRKSLADQIRLHKAKIAHERDELRDLLNDAVEICDSCDRAIYSLEDAIDGLSELL